jgi:hypothetical protein
MVYVISALALLGAFSLIKFVLLLVVLVATEMRAQRHKKALSND